MARTSNRGSFPLIQLLDPIGLKRFIPSLLLDVNIKTVSQLRQLDFQTLRSIGMSEDECSRLAAALAAPDDAAGPDAVEWDTRIRLLEEALAFAREARRGRSRETSKGVLAVLATTKMAAETTVSSPRLAQAALRGANGHAVHEQPVRRPQVDDWEHKRSALEEETHSMLVALAEHCKTVDAQLVQLAARSNDLADFEDKLAESRLVSNIGVAVRFRPFNSRERRRSIVERSQPLQITIPSMQLVSLNDGERKRDFAFDFIFGPQATQEAYGQTGAGKTFTMFGPVESGRCAPELWGIVPRFCRVLFGDPNAASAATKAPPRRMGRRASWIAPKAAAAGSEQLESQDVLCTYLQIYNDTVYDLLATREAVDKALHVRSTKSECVVEGAVKMPVASVADFEYMLEEGANRRKVAATQMNAVSSRSHTVLIVERVATIVSLKTGRKRLRRSKLTLVDLAGAERVRKSGSTGATFKEATYINRSLTTLGTCISTLSEASAKKGRRAAHVPYRNSKLTHLLQNSLGGNCRTLLLLSCSPHGNNLHETISTLGFGHRAKSVSLTSSAGEELVVDDDDERLVLARRELEAAAKAMRAEREATAELYGRVEALGHATARRHHGILGAIRRDLTERRLAAERCLKAGSTAMERARRRMGGGAPAAPPPHHSPGAPAARNGSGRRGTGRGRASNPNFEGETMSPLPHRQPHQPEHQRPSRLQASPRRSAHQAKATSTPQPNLQGLKEQEQWGALTLSSLFPDDNTDKW